MLCLSSAFLLASYVLKIFFPQEFVTVINYEGIVAIGEYIDTHAWSKIIYYTLISIVFDWLYFGAVTKSLIPKTSLIVTIVVYGVLLSIYYTFAPIEVISKYSNVVVALSTCYMILLPMFYTKELKPLSITYVVNFVSQMLLLLIRDFTTATANTSAISSFVWGIDNYVWIALCYIIFNYKNQNEKEMCKNGKFQTFIWKIRKVLRKRD